jgi:regulator of PEP synthase PpsR (kinase-PPPase family)
MQKALTQMNVQIANVISDVSGLTGQTIIRAMVAGERDPQKLAELSDPRIHASREEVAKSLEGNWRPELLFVLQQEVEMYDTYQQRIAECDLRLQEHLASLSSGVGPISFSGQGRHHRSNRQYRSHAPLSGKTLQSTYGLSCRAMLCLGF